jgi:hypothetical protein
VGGNGPSTRITPELNLWAQAIRGSARSLKRRREMGYRRSGSSWAAAEPHYYEARGMAAPEGAVPSTQIPIQTTAATAYRAPKRAAGAAFLARRRTALTVVGIVAGASVPAFALVAALTAPSMHTGDLNNVTADAPSMSVPVQGPATVEQPAAATQADSAAVQQADEAAAQQQAVAQQAAQQGAAQQEAAQQEAAQQEAAQQEAAQQAAAQEAARTSSAADPAAKAKPVTTPKHVVVKAPTHQASRPSVHTEPSKPSKPAGSAQHTHHSSRGEHSSHHASTPSAPSTSSGGTTITGGAAPAAPSQPSAPTGPSVSQDPADPANNSNPATPTDPARDPSNPDYGADNPAQPAPGAATPSQPVSGPATPSRPAPADPAAPPVTKPPVAKPPVTKHSGDRFEPRDTDRSVHASDADPADTTGDAPAQPTTR